MTRLSFNTERVIDTSLECFMFLARNLDIADRLIGKPFHIEKTGKEGYRGGLLGFRGKLQLTDFAVEDLGKGCTIKYALQIISLVFLAKGHFHIVVSGRPEDGKTRVSVSINAESRSFTSLAFRIGRTRFHSMTEALFDGFEQAARMLAYNPEGAMKQLNEDQKVLLREHLSNQLKEREPAALSTAMALLSIIHADTKSLVKFSAPAPQPRKSRYEVRITPEVREEFVNSFAQLAKLGSFFARGKREERESLGREIYDKMVELGKRLYATYVLLEIHGYLTSFLDYSAGMYLGIEAEGEDAELPWELLHNGDDFLALLIPVSRIPGEARYSKPIQKIHSVLILAPNPYDDLSETFNEAQAIYEVLRQSPGFHVKILMGSDATKENFLREFEQGRYQALHYSGHSEYNRESPRSSYLILNDGRKLRADELNRLAKEKDLKLVFLNSCFSAIGNRERMDVAGLADAFVKSGVPCVLGMRWEVSDKGARIFATHFYQELQKAGNPAEALRKARRRVGESLDWEDPAWAAPIMYTT